MRGLSRWRGQHGQSPAAHRQAKAEAMGDGRWAIWKRRSEEPRQQRSLVNSERASIMKMLAGPLPGRATRIENSGALVAGKARKLQFFESRGGDRRDFGPTADRRRRRTSCLAEPSIG